MSQNVYRDPIIKKVIERLNAEGPTGLKNRYHYGDILLAPKNQMPFCSIAIEGQLINSGDSFEDANAVSLVLTVVTSVSEQTQNWDIMGATNKLYELIAARNDDYSLRKDSLAYVMRKYAQMDTKLFTSINEVPMQVDFGIGVGRRGAGMYSVEGTLKVAMTAYTETPHRAGEPGFP